MEVLGHLVVVVEALVEVGLAVAVEVVQDHDLVAAGDVDLAVDDLQPQRLEQPRGDPLPGQLAGRAAGVLVLSSSSCQPATSQTSPSQVQTTPRSPSGKKSEPVNRIWQARDCWPGA